MIKVNGQFFEIIEDYRTHFDEEVFANRYSDILDKYDYIVGDIGYEQLRLKGFYSDSNKKAELSKRFSTIQDYLLEYCNFGCPYFILKNVTAENQKKLKQQEQVVLEEDKLKDVKIQPSIQHSSDNE